MRLIKLKFWLPLLAWMGVIYYFSSIPAKDIPPLFPFQDIFYHFISYAMLGYLFIRAVKNIYPIIKPRHTFYLALIFGTAYALSDEFHQLFVPGRCFSGQDLIIDAIGTFIGSLKYQWQR